MYSILDSFLKFTLMKLSIEREKKEKVELKRKVGQGGGNKIGRSGGHSCQAGG